MKNQTIFSLIFLFSISITLNSCGGAGVRLGGKALQGIMKSFAKNAGKNSTRLVRYAKTSRTAVTKNGRIVPYGQVAKFNKIKIPNPKRLHVIKNGGSVEGSNVAKSSVKNAEIDLLLYDSKGNAIIYADDISNGLMYKAASREYQRKAVKIVDDILLNVKKSKVSTDAELKGVINATVKNNFKQSATHPVVLDASTGNLTFNVEFYNGSQIVGNINIYNTIKKGLIVGGAGYYVTKKI